jgi:hypothetical protein
VTTGVGELVPAAVHGVLGHFLPVRQPDMPEAFACMSDRSVEDMVADGGEILVQCSAVLDVWPVAIPSTGGNYV